MANVQGNLAEIRSGEATGGGSSSYSKMRSSIKAFPMSMDERYVNQIWDQLKRAIQKILTKDNSDKLVHEEHYRNAYTLVLHKYGEKLYNGTREVVAEHVTKIKDEAVASVNNNFLATLNALWRDYQTAIVRIRDILMYMDRVYVNQQNLPSVYNLGLTVFKEQVVRHPVVCEHLCNTLLEMVARERRGETVPRSQIKDACNMLCQLGVDSLQVYEEIFERAFLDQLLDFCRAVCADIAALAASDSASQYFKMVETRITEEVERARHCLDSSTEPKIVPVLEEELITRHMRTFVEMESSGLVSMLRADKHEDIHCMYRLLQRVPEGLKIMTDCISAYLREQGEEVIAKASEEPPAVYLQVLLDQQARYNCLLEQAFKRDRHFEQQLWSSQERLIRHPVVCELLRSTLLEMVVRDRGGETVPRTQIKDACNMLCQLGVDSLQVYQDVFELAFLEQLRSFYRRETGDVLTEGWSLNLYRNMVESRITEEVERARHYLDRSTEPKIVTVLEEELITRHMRAIVEMESSGLVSMLRADKHEDIHCMYRLLHRVPEGLKIMTDCISAYLREQGKAVVAEDNKEPAVYVQALLNLRDRCDSMLAQALNRDRLFKQQISSDFEHFVNLNPRSPEYLSLFIDEKLRRGARGAVADNEVEPLLDKCMVLFRYLQEKDVFEKYYKQHLAKRLILNKSSSDDTEKSMISKLKAECGCQFTSKLEGMLKDMTVSNMLNDEFLIFLGAGGQQMQCGIDFGLRVLTTGFWPTQTAQTKIALPEEARVAYEQFHRFYMGKHSGRQLTLQPNMGSADLAAVFSGAPPPQGASQAAAASADDAAPPPAPTGAKRRYILSVSSYQMVVLMLFNRRSKFTFEQLQAETNIPEKDLQRALGALCMQKAAAQKFLNKEPRTKEIGATDEFSVNDAFYSPNLKCKVARSVWAKETEPERRVTWTRVDEDRKYEIDAAIVGIMKTKQTLSHNCLITELIEQLKNRFAPTLQAIKSRIECLIERDYIKRSEQDRHFYQYVA